MGIRLFIVVVDFAKLEGVRGMFLSVLVTMSFRFRTPADVVFTIL